MYLNVQCIKFSTTVQQDVGLYTDIL